MSELAKDRRVVTNLFRSAFSSGEIHHEMLIINFFVLLLSMPVATFAVPAADPSASNPWATDESASSSAPSSASANMDWLNAAPAAEQETTINWLDPFQETIIPLNQWVEQGLDWLVANFRPVFQTIRWPIDAILTSIESTLQTAPALLVILVFVLLAWQMVGIRLAIGTFISLVVGRTDRRLVRGHGDLSFGADLGLFLPAGRIAAWHLAGA